MTTTIDPQNTGAQPRTSEADGASLEKVRDLLFGVHMRDYDRKFARLEERLAKETSDLREDVKKRLAAIEALIRQEVESLSERLKSEQDERSTAAKDLARELNESARTFERRASQLDDQMARGLRDLRQQLHDQQQGLSDELRMQADDSARPALARVAGAARRQGRPHGAGGPLHRDGHAPERRVQAARCRGRPACLMGRPRPPPPHRAGTRSR